MAEIVRGDAGGGPATHALVVGVSHYPHLAAGSGTTASQQYGLEDLTSAARSASEVAAWLLDEYHNPAAPLASLQVFLSPAPGEVLAPGIAQVLESQPAAADATRDAVEPALLAFQARLGERRDNVGFVYVAGHGVQLTKRDAIVLLADFGRPGRVGFYGAIDMVGCHDGLDGDAYAATQFWFVDACRQVPEIAQRIEKLAGSALTLEVPPGEAEASPMYLAAASRDAAFAQVGGTTLFSQAVLAGLRGAAAAGPEDDRALGWHVPAGRLGEVVKQITRRLADDNGAEQSVQPTGWPGRAVVHRFKVVPTVRVILDVDPPEAAPHTRLSLLFDANDGRRVVDGVTGPVDETLPAGAYQVRVETDAPYAPAEPRLIHVVPLEYRDTVKVLP